MSTENGDEKWQRSNSHNLGVLTLLVSTIFRLAFETVVRV
jgi:hypothetical protein